MGEAGDLAVAVIEDHRGGVQDETGEGGPGGRVPEAPHREQAHEQAREADLVRGEPEREGEPGDRAGEPPMEERVEPGVDGAAGAVVDRRFRSARRARVDHPPSSPATCGSTSSRARRRSSAKSISVQGRPVTSTHPTWRLPTSRCRASSYSLSPSPSRMTCSSRRTSSGPASAPHLKKPTPSPTCSHDSGTTFLPSAITRSPRV